MPPTLTGGGQWDKNDGGGEDVGVGIVVLPNDVEARHLTDPVSLELLLIGRPKPVGGPLGPPQVLAMQHKEQLRCLLRLMRVRRFELSEPSELCVCSVLSSVGALHPGDGSACCVLGVFCVLVFFFVVAIGCSYFLLGRFVLWASRVCIVTCLVVAVRWSACVAYTPCRAMPCHAMPTS